MMAALDIMKEVGHRWQNLKPAERNEFQKKADKDKVRYFREQKAFYEEIERIGREGKLPP